MRNSNFSSGFSSKVILFYGIILVFQLLFMESLAQVYYRVTAGDWLFRRTGVAIYELDEYRNYRVKSNLSYRHTTNEFDVTYYTDRYGLRSDSRQQFVQPAKDSGAYRILFLGPSFTFGWAGDFDDIYVTRIAKQLSVKSRRIEVINLGTPSQPPAHQLCWVERVGAEFHPDMVVQTVYGSTDLIDTECSKPHDQIIVKDGYLIAAEPTMLGRFLGKAKQSAIVFYGWYAYQYLITSKPHSTGMGTDFYDEKRGNRSDSAATNDTVLYADYIKTIREHLGQNTEVAFIYIPYSYVVRPDDATRWSHLNNLDPIALRDKAAEVTLSLNDISINFINPLNALIDRDKLERTYYYLDIHFTEAGNDVLADVAAPILQKLIENHLTQKLQALELADHDNSTSSKTAL
ncbi:MAG: hypothetical protein OEM64_03345 [Gammaproteobacteria bacterium]|nr:hypothetical protein [Gammaproteobacteria bacterium]MDH3415326.1 hypothetical protein [Gammaproteobacteria bacterium]